MHIPLLLLWAILSASIASGQTLEFHDQDAGQLKVKVVKIADAIDGLPSALMTVDVSNPTEYWAEPLEFLVPTKKRKDLAAHIAPRVEAPYYGRAGRAIAPGGKLRYYLSLRDAPKRLSKSKVKVAHASFFSGDGLLAAPVEVGDIDVLEKGNDFSGGKLRISRVQLHNTSAFTVDAILKAEFSYPGHGEALVRFRLAPGEERVCTVDGVRAGFTLSPELLGSVVESIELVDWSALRAGEENPGVAILRSAFDAQAKWPIKDFEYEAEYEVEIETYDWQSKGRILISEVGTCKSKGGFANFEPVQGKQVDSDIQGALLLGHVNRYLSTPDFETWTDDGKVELHTLAEDMAVVSVTFDAGDEYLNRCYWIADNRIVRRARYPFSGLSVVYEHKQDSRGISAVRETQQTINKGPSSTDDFFRIQYKRIDGFQIPYMLHKERRFRNPEQNTVVRLKLSNVKILGSPPSVPPLVVPTGDLAMQVRAAWERGHQYPREAMDLSGDFVMTNPGSDLAWHKKRKVQGSFHMQGMQGQGWDRADVELKGRFTEELKFALGDTVRDRLGMFMERDFCGRLPFDEQFAGASFEEINGKLLVNNCWITQLDIRDGRLAAYWTGAERKLTWATIDDVEVPARAECGDESVTFKRKEVAGYWFPVEIVMTGMFPDGGPEKVTLKNLKFEQPGS